MNCRAFLDRVAEELGSSRVFSQSTASARYGSCTMGTQRIISGAVRPISKAQVQSIVQASREFGVPLYPISTGNNWGYGSSLPTADGCVIVDLSDMTAITLDAETGLATLEPGVTQRILRQYLDENFLRFLCPVTGAGPDCSLVGNALERGYGITPYADHFMAVMSLEAVLPDGRIYRPPLAELGCPEIDKAFKWGVGPFLDGIFSQGAFGIVTEMTIALAPLPERVEAFFFGLPGDGDLECAVDSIRDLLRDVGADLGSINLLDMRRVLSMMEPYPRDHLDQNGLIDEQYLSEIARQNQVMPWMGTGAIYGHPYVVRAVKKLIRKNLPSAFKKLVFFTPRSVGNFKRLSDFMPGKAGQGLQNMLATLDKTLQALAGSPSEVALPLAYWISGKKPDGNTPLNPARDGCGLIWYTPLVPLRAEKVREYVQMVRGICVAHRVEPLITLTSLSNRCFVSSVPLLFDRAREEAVERAVKCYTALIEAGREIGCIPYRATVDSMERFIKPEAPYWQIVSALKRELDPEGLLAPGRYSPR
ncbi:FAD/FMN-containing dehydrogenase [Nitrosospira sp. Nsp2]|uniref:FAD-binding oxidoreductase n=1 Tax=Nitrosospira sp. Nsp2 TaxID=136548 RepID=UPI000D46F2F2|nr:FAD-binding oxidoreductase [Nitrosospira sp. Nsp2]PTR15597.1 FAD/FMN-containing dehydrogenase [Nitrosospira sp. Nsp2]